MTKRPNLPASCRIRNPGRIRSAPTGAAPSDAIRCKSAGTGSPPFQEVRAIGRLCTRQTSTTPGPRYASSARKWSEAEKPSVSPGWVIRLHTKIFTPGAWRIASATPGTSRLGTMLV